MMPRLDKEKQKMEVRGSLKQRQMGSEQEYKGTVEIQSTKQMRKTILRQKT